MKVIGVTGGVGAGKSEVLGYIAEHWNATVVEADEVGYLVTVSYTHLTLPTIA